MRRGVRIALLTVVVLAALLAVNAIVLERQTKPAEVNAPGGEILELSSVDLQVVDHPPTGAGPPGEPIVLLHGFAGSLRWWDAVLPALNERHRVVAIDLIGHGGSEKPQSGYEITSQGAAVAEALSRLGVQRATIVGHSMGGAVATSLAETASEVADRVVLIDSRAEVGQAQESFTARAVRVPVIGHALWRVRFGALIKSGYEPAFAPGFDMGSAFEDPDQVVRDSEAMTYGSFNEAGGAGEDFLEEEPLVSRLNASGVPLLVLLGSEDQLLDVQEVEASFEGALSGRTEVIEGSGHSPQLEAPEETARLILDFAEEGEAPPAPARAGRGAAGGPAGGAGTKRRGRRPTG